MNQNLPSHLKGKLALLSIIDKCVRNKNSQFTSRDHSSYPSHVSRRNYYSFDSTSLVQVNLQDTSHYQITRGILEAPDRYWRQLAQFRMK